jgi:hypothetical protein
MTDWNTLPDPEAESTIWNQLKVYAEIDRVKWGTIGLMAHEVRKRGLWKARTDPEDGFPCRSFNRWVQICPYPHSTVRAALADVDELKGDVSAADLAEIPQSNFSTMKLISTDYRKRPDVLKAAKSLGLDKFMAKTYPEQHLSDRSPFRLTPTDEQRAEIEEAIELAIQCGDATSKEEAIFMWAINYRQERQQRIMDSGECAHA